MATKKPPAALMPVRAILDKAGYGPLKYSDEWLRLDRLGRFIPLPGRSGVTVEEAAQAAFVCARAREGTGHMCPVVGWYLLALSPEKEAHERLRAALDAAVGRVADQAANGRLQLPAISGEMGDEIAEGAIRKADGFRNALTRIVELGTRGDDRQEAQAVIDEMFVDRGTPQHSAAAAFRKAAHVVYKAIGGPLSDADMAAMMAAMSRFDDQSGNLYGLLMRDEGLWELTRGSARSLTDLDYVRGLLQEVSVDELRKTLLDMLSPRLRGMGHADLQKQGVTPHQGQACKPACDHAAWMVCFLLEPANRRMWELLNGDPDQIVAQAVRSLME
ncbi:hypothetical protein AB0K81_02695 [Streptomyces werraensis]|uniref:Uncharacterized protein n=1 Tax=Streptomyces werraensis TaxID=68284 RepID=A0ABV3J9W4_9ACTN